VWIANRERPIAQSGLNAARLRISRDGNLVVSILHNHTVVWTTNGTIANRTSRSIVLLMNTGNLVVLPKAPSNGIPPLWHPTDVGLPSANIGCDKIIGSDRFGISKKSLIDPSFGSCTIQVDTDTGRCALQVAYRPT
jgi:hypothetical protein